MLHRATVRLKQQRRVRDRRNAFRQRLGLLSRILRSGVKTIPEWSRRFYEHRDLNRTLSFRRQRIRTASPTEFCDHTILWELRRFHPVRVRARFLAVWSGSSRTFSKGPRRLLPERAAASARRYPRRRYLTGNVIHKSQDFRQR